MKSEASFCDVGVFFVNLKGAMETGDFNVRWMEPLKLNLRRKRITQ